MRTFASIILGSLLVISPALARVADLSLTSSGGKVQVSFMSKQVTREEMKGLLGKLATIGKDQLLHIRVDDTVPAAVLVEVIREVQSAGLHNVVLVSPAEENGKKGTNQITIDCRSRKADGGIPDVEPHSGFHEGQEEPEPHPLEFSMEQGTPKRNPRTSGTPQSPFAETNPDRR